MQEGSTFMLDDSPQAVQAENYLDKERLDLLNSQGFLEMMKFLLSEEVPKNDAFRDFPIQTSKMPGSTFLEEGDEYEIMMNECEISAIIHNMAKPRSEKTREDVILNNERRLMLRLNLHRSIGAKGQKTNILTVATSTFRHNIHSVTEQQAGGQGMIRGMIGKLRGL